MGRPESAKDVEMGELIGGYRLERLLGAGSTSKVFLGHHVLLNRSAAIKVLEPTLVSNEGVVARLLNEARVVNDVRHPNIIEIMDFIVSASPPRVALVMELIEGPSLKSLRGDPLTPRQAIGVALQLVDAVEAAHAAGVIHRDLKPDNLLLTGDPRLDPTQVPRLKVVDFGIAKLAGSGGKTATGMMLGTPAYMAPEQIAGRPAPSPATDVFAVGEVLFELLTGRRLYPTAAIPEIVRTKLRGDVPPIELPALPGERALSALVERCVELRPTDRPSLREVKRALLELPAMPDRVASTAGEGRRATPSPAPSPTRRAQTSTARGSEASPPRVGEASPPRVGDASPSRVGEACPLRVGEASPLRVGEASPLRVGEASPLRVGEASPPRVGEASPPRVGEASPPRVGEASPLRVVEAATARERSRTPPRSSIVLPADIPTQDVAALRRDPVVARALEAPGSLERIEPSAPPSVNTERRGVPGHDTLSDEPTYEQGRLTATHLSRTMSPSYPPPAETELSETNPTQRMLPGLPDGALDAQEGTLVTQLGPIIEAGAQRVPRPGSGGRSEAPRSGSGGRSEAPRPGSGGRSEAPRPGSGLRSQAPPTEYGLEALEAKTAPLPAESPERQLGSPVSPRAQRDGEPRREVRPSDGRADRRGEAGPAEVRAPEARGARSRGELTPQEGRPLGPPLGSGLAVRRRWLGAGIIALWIIASGLLLLSLFLRISSG